MIVITLNLPLLWHLYSAPYKKKSDMAVFWWKGLAFYPCLTQFNCSHTIAAILSSACCV